MPPSRSFLHALNFTLGWEQGFVDDPDDPGGRTIYGISERAHPDLWRHGPPTMDQAAARYERDYWNQIKGNLLPPDVAFIAFDMSVLQGPQTAVMALQRTIGVRADGQLGPKTLKAIGSYPGNLAKDLLDERVRLLIANGKQKYLFGWVRRCLDQSYWLGTTNWTEF